MLLDNLKPSLESNYSRESSRLCNFKMKKTRLEFSGQARKFSPICLDFSDFGCKVPVYAL
jgi:hypothetical protein